MCVCEGICWFNPDWWKMSVPCSKGVGGQAGMPSLVRRPSPCKIRNRVAPVQNSDDLRFVLKLVRITTKKYHTMKEKPVVEYSQDISQPAIWWLVHTVWQESVFFFSHSWLVKKVKNVDLLLYISPFLFYNFVSRTCTLEVTLHSASFFLFRLCFK